MENKKQTALDWLTDQIIDNPDIYIEGNTLVIPNDIFRKAKQMHKEQIKDSFVECWKANVPEGIECKLSAEEYYKKTYGKN